MKINDRNSISIKINKPAALKNAKIKNKTECTGLRALITIIEDIKAIISKNEIIDAQKVIEEIYVDEKVEDYILNLIFATRDPSNNGLEDLVGIIEYGASPRATINLVRAAKARAFTENRGYITPEDIRNIGADVLRHRIILSYEAEAEELTSEDVIQRLFEVVEVP